MSTRPIYRIGHKRYGIDDCEPQKEAVREGKIDFHALTKGHYPGTLIPKDILPGLNSIGFWDANTSQDWGMNPHRNEGIKIVFFETGTCDLIMDQKTFNLHAGNFLLTRPWQLHKFGNPNIGRGRLHWLILDVGVRQPHQNWSWPKWVVMTKNDRAELTERWRHIKNPVWTSTPSIAQSFRELARCVTAWDQPHAVSRMAVHLNLLLIDVLDALSEQQTQETPHLTSRQRTVELFLHEVEHNPAVSSELWTIDSMAKHCGMGVTAFSKYCREITNVGPMEFLNHCRLDRAAQQLREKPGLSVTDVAFANGFNSSQYFATRFRRRFHVSPKRFASEPNGSVLKQ
jgi:AraC family L-rhamnose operon regulatory protein RhaS